MRVLVVDDNAANRYLLEVVLKANGHEAVSAENGQEALERLRSEHIDLIVSDVMMPRMDGYQLCRECKRDPALDQIPLIFVTAAYTDEQDERFALRLGAARYVRRPIDTLSFVHMLAEVLHEQKASAPSTPPELPQEDARYFSEYSGRVVHKLEDKLKELETESSERERAESEKQAFELRFRALVEQASDLVATLDANGVIQYISPAVLGLLGYEPAEVAGRNLVEFAHPDDAATARADIATVAREPGVLVRTLRYRERGGSFRSMQSSSRSCLDDPAVRGIIVNARDVTESERALALLRASELRYRTLFESAQDGIAVVDDQTGRIADANPYLLRLLGYARDELIGKQLWELGLFPDADANALAFAELARAARFERAATLTARHGQRVDVEFAAHAYLCDQNRLVQCSIRDITEKRRNERRLLHRVAMEHLVTSISTRLANASLTEVDEEIVFALRDLAQSADADRCWLYTASPETMLLRVTHAWHAPGLAPEHTLSVLDLESVPWAAMQLRERRVTYVARLLDLPPQAELGQEREFLARLGLRSFMFVPMVHGEKMAGVVAWGSAHEGSFIEEADKSLLRAVGDVFASTLARREAQRALERTNRALRVLSLCNAAVIRATDTPALLDEICRMIVQVGGYRSATARFTNEDGAAPRLVASHGLGENASDEPGATVQLALVDQARSFGTLSIDAAALSAFDQTEVQLLKELAEDVSFGLSALRTRAERDRSQHESRLAQETLRQRLEESIQAIAATVERRDPFTAGHQRRVALLCSELGRKLGLDEERIHGLRLAAIIHDVGKIQIPADILNRPGRLSPLEFELVKSHPQIGRDIIKDVRLPWDIAEMIWQHHEHVDGSGYPRGLRGEQLSLESRILLVADVAEAMMAHRPYRPALEISAAIEELQRHRGSYYDADVADACIEVLRVRSAGTSPSEAHEAAAVR